ncbi:DUF3800 domain-containing protein [Bradyrhizobium liaoningense]|uniref:DUF3800 domain-containing protein n=1 Tax=Bradyrhizobium liaoningense TaxID=43992 RepID=UPI001BA5B0F2|nr:DUF3800 domain-containing protein [Bradyrhizobium liaoningense]MBR0982344.1 DUF3800 domain-containing protein [Bradyrhizobium liaoningense]
MATEYIIYCDESDEKGTYFSNFYGGTLVESQNYQAIVDEIRARKTALNLHKEVKWTRITEHYADKYIALIDTFFDLVKVGKIKVRIMFTQNTVIAKNLTPQHVEEKYFILYYQFLKHAFGLAVSPILNGGVNLRIYPDQIPDNKERVEQFRGFLMGLAGSPPFRERRIRIRREDIADVDSKQHEILQCLDIVLGAVNFRLNDKHKEKTAKGGTRRGSRTKAKERVYRHILGRIQDIYPRFNIGRSTGQDSEECRWSHPYRHWLFTPSERIVIPGSKREKKKGAP